VTLGHDDLTNGLVPAGKEVEGLAVLDRPAAIRQLTLDLNTSTLRRSSFSKIVPRFALHGHIVAGIESDPVAKPEDLVACVPGDKMLGPTLTDLETVWPEAGGHQVVLSVTRNARNCIAHESPRFGIHSRWESLGERILKLRRVVRAHADGDNLVSTRWFFIEERHQVAPSGLIAKYPTMID